MEFEILSHAGLRVRHAGTTLIVDPWLVGSAYWRSWWNYPPLDDARVRALRADFVYLTHIHWDHFHGPSLRMLGKDLHILIPEDRYDRMSRDLRSLGFRHITELPHGREFSLRAGFSIRPFMFFPVTDSLIAIQAGNSVLLNANDCKICGWPLRQVKRLYPRVDFVLRSHSSANTRLCQEYLDAGENAGRHEEADSKQDYLRSFANFMRAIKPRYAVPFASNHCHLHPDTRHFNRWQQTPRDVQDFFKIFKAETGIETELVTMLPGSVWSEEAGFALEPEGRWFLDREQLIETYARENASKLTEYTALESRTRVSEGEIQRYFTRLHSHTPRFWRRKFANGPVFLKSISGSTYELWEIDLYAGRVSRATDEQYDVSDMRVEIPAIVLKQALRMNMFSHAGISKRVRWLATRRCMPLLNLFMQILDFEEYELLPLRRNFSLRSVRVWMRRWREIVGYVQLLWIMKRRRISGKQVEQVALVELS